MAEKTLGSLSVPEIPHAHSTVVSSVIYKLLAAAWHLRKGRFLEHSFGGAGAACHSPPWHVSLLSGPEGIPKKQLL